MTPRYPFLFSSIWSAELLTKSRTRVVVRHLAKEGVASKNRDATVSTAEPRNANFKNDANRWPKIDCEVSTFTVAPQVKHTVSSFVSVELQSRQRIIWTRDQLKCTPERRRSAIELLPEVPPDAGTRE